MSLRGNSELVNVADLREEQKWRIRGFLQGAVCCWCKNQQTEWFSLRDLLKELLGDNEWEGTPLVDLYLKYENRGSSDPVKGAGMDAGRLLKAVLVDDETREFGQEKRYRANGYRWIPRRKKT